MTIDTLKMKRITNWKLVLLALPILLISGCGGIAEEVTDQEEIGPLAWIDAPLAGQTIALDTYEVVSHANSASGIVAFELSVNGEILRTDEVSGEQNGQPLAHIRQIWVPPGPGTYLLSIRAQDLEDVFGPSAEVEVHIAEKADSIAGLPTSEPTSVLEACTYTALVNLFCRVGPGGQYKEIDTFTAGQSAPVVGISVDAFYAYVIGPHNGQLCTVPTGDQFGVLSGDCGAAPAFTPIPLPSATPTPTPTCAPGIAGC